MSWELELYGEATEVAGSRCAPLLGSWNYTHNMNRMIEAALADAGDPVPEGQAWFRRLHGMEGPDGARMLHKIASVLDADPARFDAMNPPNGWGSREGLVEVLREVVRAVPGQPCRWSACG